MTLLRLLVVIVIYFHHVTDADAGVDVSDAVSESGWQCVLNNYYDFAIVRVYLSSGKVDPNGANTIKNARSAGLKKVDGYILPCFSCGNPAGQVQATVNNLMVNNASFDQLWIDVSSNYWSINTTDNINFIQSMVNEAKSIGVTVGIYTSNYNWDYITGNTEDFSNLPLWYADFDNRPNFSGYVPIGGWMTPFMKQYTGMVMMCGFTVDFDWHP